MSETPANASLTPFLYGFRAVVHLNNVGVSLLQRRCYRQAMLTFGDAIAIMKALSPAKASEDNSFDHAPVLPAIEVSSDIEGKLKRAAQRLAKPIPSKIPSMGALPLEVLSDDEILKAEANTAKLYLICLDTIEFEAADYSEFNFVSSVILYNHGIAYRCLGALSSSLPFVEKLDKGALHMFTLAYATANQAILMGKQSQVLLIATLALRNLVQLSQHLGHLTEGNEYNRRLSFLHDEIKLLGAIEEKLLACGARAA